MVTVMKLIIIMSLSGMTMGASVQQTFSLTPNFGVPKSCIAPNNQEGICVDESICNEDHTIIPTGIIEDDELRMKKSNCNLQGDWCCTTDLKPQPVIGDIESDKCLPLDSDVCPWCVLLYRVADVTATAPHPFCLGALIGSKVILTSASCIIGARKKMLYAQIPNSADPQRNYTVLRRESHPYHNTGTREHDFGIVVIDSDVTFEKGKARGACLDFGAQFQNFVETCVSYGFDNKWKISSTILNVSESSSCSESGKSSDAACGRSTETVCIVASGGPVACRRNNELFLRGIARGMCEEKMVLLGSIYYSKDWIDHKLAIMNVPKYVYTQD